MTKRQVLLDDLSPDLIDDSGISTVAFSWDGVDYTIDLNTENRQKFEEMITVYVAHATRVGGEKIPARKLQAKSDGVIAQIRVWAIQNGYDVKPKGRIPAEIVAAYEGRVAVSAADVS